MLVAAILAVALAARLGLALLYEPPPPSGDVADYMEHAAALADEGRYPESKVTVGRPSNRADRPMLQSMDDAERREWIRPAP